MADKEEKIIPEAEEAKTEAPVEEAAPVEEVAPEAKEEKKEVKKEKKEKKEPKAKKEKAEKKPFPVKLVAIIGGAVIGVAVIALLIVALVSGSSAISAYNAKDYEKAYNSTKMAWFMNGSDKDVVKEAYITNVLCPDGQYIKAYEIMQGSSMSQDKKDALMKKNSGLALCEPGQVVTFGKYEQDGKTSNGAEDVEWIVLDVIKEDGFSRALLLSKNILGSSGGWGTKTTYADSDLHSWCDTTFFNAFAMNVEGTREKVLKVSISTPDSSDGNDSGPDVVAQAYAPSKQEIETYLTGDLAQYIKAGATAYGKKGGVTAVGKDMEASYYVRNIGTKDGDDQFAAGYTKDGEFKEGFSMSGAAIGSRVCINVNLGES